MNHDQFMATVPPALEEADLYQRRREPLLNYEDQYGYLSDNCLERFESTWKKMADPSTANWGAAGLRAQKTVSYLCLQYSAGIEVAALAQFYPTAIWAWEEYRKHFQPYNDSEESAAKGNSRIPALSFADMDYGDYAIPLACMGLLLGHKVLMSRLCEVWDYVNEELNYFDILLENLVRPYVPGRDKVPEQYTRHLPYRKLDKVFKASADKRPALMQKYLDEWYHASRREPYYDMDSKLSFVGYWSWESAAVTWLLDIDDSSYRDMDFYPRDLADFARQFDNHPIAPVPDLCAYPGQVCPKAGVWFAPNDHHREITLQAGETFPQQDRGATGGIIWYYKQDQSPK